MDLSNINSIARNSNNFNFVDTLASFINNILYKLGYIDYASGRTNLHANIWNVLSAISEDYADTIYENVLNYLDNVSNVDLCKVKSLLSMINVVGLKYDVFDAFNAIPVELANLIDILSINRSYILQSDKFSTEFIDLLSASGIILNQAINRDELDSELSGDNKANVKIKNAYISDDKWKKFLLELYLAVLNKYVFLQYADAENNLSSEHTYIYEYILTDILASYSSASDKMSDHQKTMIELKTKYGLSKTFDQEKIVDDIENGYDSIENYNALQLEVIKQEILHRENTYSYVKRYANKEEKFLGYNLTRYSYYREKKVKEYFQYIENTYNNMILESGIKSAIGSNSNTKISMYDKDHDFFVIDLVDREQFLKYDTSTKTVELQTSFIDQIAHLLVDLTLLIASIRDLVKTQVRKSYMRGTFLLISYVINEFLKYGLLNKYGMYFTTDDGVYLSTILQLSFNTDNVLLVEYYDNTEYFNITTSNDISALNSETVNEKFWDNSYNKIGINSEDIPLDEIENFYLNQLKLKKNTGDSIINFLSVIYEYGANDSFISKDTNEFVCRLPSEKRDGDSTTELSAIQSNHYTKQKEIYLKYNGTEIGYDPFYNYKNMAYSSYQIHPYLYNFIEKTNLVYPLANNFLVTFSEEYEQEIYEKTIDNIIGQYGNIKDLWRSGLFDWTGYLSLYEKRGSLLESNAINANIGYTGLFYPPALNDFIDNPSTFILDVLDDVLSSYYHHLNLNVDACNRIAEQLTAYYDAIQELVLNKQLSNEYDIYKYAEDANGNQLFLLKSYKHLYQLHIDEPDYVPSYNEKKNTLGELWMRIKDHPLAFPAFDIRNGCENISQYNIEENLVSRGRPINKYLYDIDRYFSVCNASIRDYTKDLISRNNDDSSYQYVKCFFDFELSPTKRSILLNVPYKTGTNSVKTMIDNDDNHITSIDLIRYADSSVIAAYLEDAGLNTDGIHIFNFTSQYVNSHDDNLNIDNILNPKMLINGHLAQMKDEKTLSNIPYFYEFVGFAKNDYYIYVIYAKKNGIAISSNGIYHSFKSISKGDDAQYITLRCVAYRLGSKLITTTITSDKLEYDIYNNARDPNIPYGLADKYKNASNIVLSYGNNQLTLGFLTERISPANTEKGEYLSASTIVNFAEYSEMLEKYNVDDEAGLDKKYPTSTALILTTDSDHINIYNSFDSFVQHIVNVTFDMAGSTLRYKNVKYFNLNSDLGYLPLYSDTFGKTKLYINPALSSKLEYAIQLLGPEKSDIPFTPIIKDTTDEKYGRVVEDYKEYNQILGYSDAISVDANANYATYDFKLSSIFPDKEWNVLTATPDLLRYRYILYNTNYESLPIAKGLLSSTLPDGYYYQWEEKYDLLSGEEILGPNLIAYQNAVMTNHIDNISALPLSIEFDPETLLPSIVHLSCVVRTTTPLILVIPANTFRLMVYAKNNVKSYDYYHIFENANSNLLNNGLSIGYAELWQIDFNQISSLSTYTLPGSTKAPFANLCVETKPNKISAMLEFKYSESDVINREFPYLDASDVEDEITIVLNDTQGIYYFALDNNKTIDRSNIKLLRYYVDAKEYIPHIINTSLPQYDEFYDRALIIESTYNLEQISDFKYEIVMYFNYKNYTNPSYVKYTLGEDNDPPSSTIYNSIDEEIKHTYLVLKPGESGLLDIRVDYVYYDKLNANAISESITGCVSQNIKRYYISNVSDDKPKFIISRKPFNAKLNIKSNVLLYELK